eukprot:7800982-Pyramimonas_sp.AAC.1
MSIAIRQAIEYHYVHEELGCSGFRSIMRMNNFMPYLIILSCEEERVAQHLSQACCLGALRMRVG